jgi:hypothetical protein
VNIRHLLEHLEPVPKKYFDLRENGKYFKQHEKILYILIMKLVIEDGCINIGLKERIVIGIDDIIL